MAVNSISIERNQSHNPFWDWLSDFLRSELAPYPGRWAIVARMAVAATSVAVICLTFRIPFGYQGAAYALLVSHEALENNWRATFRIAGATWLTTVYILVSASIFAGSPPLHFGWNVASLFLAFFCISAMREYIVAVPVAVVIAVSVPIWDRVVPPGANVADTLWLCLASTVAVFVTAGVSSVVAAFAPSERFIQPVVDRLQLAEEVLRTCAAGIPVNPQLRSQLNDAVLAGTSAWRLMLRRSGLSQLDRDRFSAVGALVGRLVDITSGLANAPFGDLPVEQANAECLADAVAEVREALVARREPRLSKLKTPSDGVAVSRQIVQTLALIAHAWVGPADTAGAKRQGVPTFAFLVPDAFKNPDHLKFAFRACLASTACYIVYKALVWPGLSSAVTTCLFTALSTVGASRQKQILRLSGAILGGLILGMGAQILVFPQIDSIFAFTLVFGFVSVIAAWIMTGTPRLSYLGFQVAYAFYLIHLQSFHFETSLTTARDRVLGVGVGLTAMWLIFDHLWSAPASLSMKRALVRSLGLLAQMARGPASNRQGDAIEECSALRETIHSTFDQVRALSDGMVFEFGPGRAEALELRELVRRLQPQLRALFVLRVSALDYRLRLPGFELPQDALTAQILFDECSAGVLQELADAIETGRPRHSSPRPCLAVRTEKLNPLHFALIQNIDSLTTAIADQIDSEIAALTDVAK